MKRKHQIELEAIINGIIHGSGIRKILCNCTPGSGKSTIPIIAGRLIAAGLADALCWICPRTALQDQGARVFVDPFFRREFSHSLTMRSSTNERNPARGTNGFITTYQAIGGDENRTVEAEIKSRRYIVVLDEFHHVEAGGLWHKALKEIMAHAAFVVLMTGTLQRGSGGQIAFIDYKKSFGTGEPVTDAPGMATITYSRTDALREKAIIPLKFMVYDGHASWRDSRGETKQVKSLARTYGYDVAPAIYTALSTDFASELLDIALAHWQRYKARHRRSKMLVVCSDIKGARRMAEHLKARSVHAEIVTSHENEKAQAGIKKFKGDSLDCIVTIAMAYEGLDICQITHIACLTHIRSTPWIEQMLARAVRVDRQAGPYESQCAYVLAPDDVLFREIMEQIKLDQAPFATRAAKQADLGLELGQDDGSKARLQVTPLGSWMTGQREEFFGNALPVEEIETPDEIEQRLRESIENHIRAYSFQNRHKPQELNAEIYRHFQKARADMDADELENVFSWIKTRWPEGFKRGTNNVRAPTKAVAWNGYN
jgi:superfamily II DNA or RNA helicase